MVGQRIKQIRMEKGLSQKAFADALSTSSGYISDLENGKSLPGTQFLIELKAIFSVSIDWLLTGNPDGGARDSEYCSDPNIAGLLEGARKVLTSGNPVAYDALERNIRYFAHAIEVEQRLAAMEARLEKIEKSASSPDCCMGGAGSERKAG